MITIVVSPVEFDGERLEIEGDVYRHLFRSRRVGVEESLRVVDGEGRARWARLDSIGSRSAVAILGEVAPSNDPLRRVAVLSALPKPDRAAWLVEKCTELGVASISFVAFERSARELSEGLLERLRRVSAAAQEQCHGSRLPLLRGPLRLERALDEDSEGAIVLLPGASSVAAASDLAAFNRLWVGPEGGFSEVEIAAIHRRGMASLSLGPRVLRVETAAVVGASALLNA